MAFTNELERLRQRVAELEADSESREYLNRVINCIRDPIFVKDRRHRFVLVNDAWCAFIGIRREDLLGQTSHQSLSKEQPALLWEEEETVFNSGGDRETEEEIIDGRGETRSIITRKSLLGGKDGEEQIVCIVRDITEHKRLEAQFRQSQKMEAVGVLAGGVAHDFNNLLSVIEGYAELLLQDLAPDDLKRADLEQIEKAAQRASALTFQLLAFSRKQILRPEILNLNNVVGDMSTLLRRLIGEDIELATITAPDLAPINADPGQIQQIIMNIAVNSRAAMPEGGKLTIETANIDVEESYVCEHPMMKEGRYVMMAISDNGIGMDAETQARIFEPFFTTKEKNKGTGLGLSTVYGIVKQSNGFIWVYSEPGKGTSFKIYFPRLEDKRVQDLEIRKSGDVSQGFETILLAEDEDSVRRLAGRILRSSGYTVLEARDGMEALALVQGFSEKIHLVITDIIMPGMSGQALVSQLENLRPEIRSLYISGYTDSAIVHHGILDSNVTFLQKPFTIESLTQKVRDALKP